MSREEQGKVKVRSMRVQVKVKVRSRQRKHNLNSNNNLMGFDTIEINLVLILFFPNRPIFWTWTQKFCDRKELI